MSKVFMEIGGIWVNPWKVCYVAPFSAGGEDIAVIGFGGKQEVGVSEKVEDVVEKLDRALARRPWHRGGRERDGDRARRGAGQQDGDNGMEA